MFSLKAVKAAYKELCWQAHRYSNLPFGITKWYGRLGNNIQQICLGVLYAQTQNKVFVSPSHPLIHPIIYNGGNLARVQPKHRNRFFYYPDRMVTMCDIDINYNYICDHIYDIAQSVVRPNLKIADPAPLDDDVLVIHLRGGDVFNRNSEVYNLYVQNPLSFYNHIIPNFSRTIVVTEPGDHNPVLPELRKLPRVTIQTSSVAEDFTTLLQARNLVSSGVGTFAIAAALCSKNLRNFFCSDRYLTSHLNPEMLQKNVKVFCTILDNYINVGEWDNTDSTRSLVLNYRLNDSYAQEVILSEF